MTRHLQRVPFENLDVVAGTAQGISTEGALRKVAIGFRGGFCYELNEAFRALLIELGFVVRRIEARVWQVRNNRFGAPFDHLALIATLPDGEFLVDVGYGDSNRSPLRVPEDRVSDISGEYCLSPLTRDVLRLSCATAPLYDLTLTEQSLQSFAAMCRYHQTSCDSLFSKGLICTRATDTGRITLSGQRLIIVDRGHRTETAVTDVAAALSQYFAINDGSFGVNNAYCRSAR